MSLLRCKNSAFDSFIECVKGHQFTEAVSKFIFIIKMYSAEDENKILCSEGNRMVSKQTNCHCHLTMKIYWVIVSFSQSLGELNRPNWIYQTRFFYVWSDPRNNCLSKEENFLVIPKTFRLKQRNAQFLDTKHFNLKYAPHTYIVTTRQ